MDRTKAFEADNGFLIPGGPFFTGGTASPVSSVDAEIGDLYVQTTGSGPKIWQKIGATTADWKLLSAEDIKFTDGSAAYRSGIGDVNAALDNIRKQRVSLQAVRNTNSESNYTLTNADNTYQLVTGSGSGYYLKLPVATTLIKGQEFEISNQSSNQIEIRTSDNALLTTLNSADIVRLICRDNSTAVGLWTVQVSSTTATGIVSYSVGNQTSFVTSSATDVILTGITTTPVSGRYACFFSADITIGTNNRLAQAVFFQNGSAVARTRRTVQGVSSNFIASMNLLGEITVNGTEAVDVRVNIDSGTLTVNAKRMFLIRLGA